MPRVRAPDNRSSTAPKLSSIQNVCSSSSMAVDVPCSSPSSVLACTDLSPPPLVWGVPGKPAMPHGSCWSLLLPYNAEVTCWCMSICVTADSQSEVQQCFVISLQVIMVCWQVSREHVITEVKLR